MELALVLLGNVVLQGAAYLVLSPIHWGRWIFAAMLIGTAYQLPFILHEVFHP